MGDYNREMEGRSDAARRSGWKRRVGQAARFEVLASRFDWSTVDSVVDLGCGTGELLGWLKDTGRSCRYTGVEMREEAVEEARERHPGGTFVEADFFEEAPRLQGHDLAVAIGSLVDGRPVADDAERRGRVERLVRRLFELGMSGVGAVLLDQDHVRERASLRLEAALFGGRRSELLGAVAEAAAARVEGPFLESDLVMCAAHDGCEALLVENPPGAREVCERVIERMEASALEEAWLWLESGAASRAEGALRRAERSGIGDRAERSLLRDRMAWKSEGRD